MMATQCQATFPKRTQNRFQMLCS